MRILHLAPERGIYNRLKPLVGAGYQTADFNPDHYKSVDPDCFFIDLCELDDQPSDNFDLIIHSHVMEHIPCNMAYTLWNLHRMLKPTGRHICIIPFLGGYHDETFAEIGGENRARRFGQNDHVRRFGREDLQRGLGAILTLPTTFDATQDFPISDLQQAAIPLAQCKGFTVSTVLNLDKYAMKLLVSPGEKVWPSDEADRGPLRRALRRFGL